jgi:hypothetical protein
MPTYGYLTYGQAKSELALRLGDSGMVRWINAELGLYLCEAMRLYNCLTGFWKAPCTIPLNPPLASNWQAANGLGSPRQQTLTDTDVYTVMEYHLLEPATGSTWTGTNQFSISDLSQACSRRLNEILQVAACNMAEVDPSVTPGTNIATLADLALDVRRVRYVPADTNHSPATLQRSDTLAFQRFTSQFSTSFGVPMRWDVIGSPPEQITLDSNTPEPASLQVLTVAGAEDFDPPAPSPLLIPDDWYWVLKFGALSDVLSKEQEGRDIQRAEYSRKRYVEGLKLMVEMPWLIQGFVNGVVVDAQPVATADKFNYEWQSRPTAFPEIVVGGIDLFALSPAPTLDTSVTLNVVQNAPIPASDSVDIQVPRDVMDAILDEAQHLALFKSGGEEFMASLKLHQSFIRTAVQTNARLRESGIFASDISQPVSRQDEDQPRFAMERKG